MQADCERFAKLFVYDKNTNAELKKRKERLGIFQVFCLKQHIFLGLLNFVKKTKDKLFLKIHVSDLPSFQRELINAWQQFVGNRLEMPISVNYFLNCPLFHNLTNTDAFFLQSQK